MTAMIEMKVKGMTCTGCEERIQGAAGELGGVEEVAADHQAHRLGDPGARGYRH
ncbi:MAG: heavy-metal-associated domain-containing protein [Acidobacteria bacterium]|nr:heavy-metal-associated domain-containing protein [Acidobacteriota bacterium]